MEGARPIFRRSGNQANRSAPLTRARYGPWRRGIPPGSRTVARRHVERGCVARGYRIWRFVGHGMATVQPAPSKKKRFQKPARYFCPFYQAYSTRDASVTECETKETAPPERDSSAAAKFLAVACRPTAEGNTFWFIVLVDRAMTLAIPSTVGIEDHFHAKSRDHLVIFLGRLAFRGQVIAHEDGIGGKQTQRLKGA